MIIFLSIKKPLPDIWQGQEQTLVTLVALRMMVFRLCGYGTLEPTIGGTHFKAPCEGPAFPWDPPPMVYGSCPVPPKPKNGVGEHM